MSIILSNILYVCCICKWLFLRCPLSLAVFCMYVVYVNGCFLDVHYLEQYFVCMLYMYMVVS